MSTPITVEQAAAKLQCRDPRVNSFQTKAFLQSIGLSDQLLVELVRNGYEFKNNSLMTLLEAMKRSGWDTSKYLYGPIKTRVEW